MTVQQFYNYCKRCGCLDYEMIVSEVYDFDTVHFENGERERSASFNHETEEVILEIE